MKIGIINTNRHSLVYEFSDKRLVKLEKQNPLCRTVKGILDYLPYRGDMDLESISWVTDIGYRLTRQYEPDFIFLGYSTPYVISMFSSQSMKAIRQKVFEEVDRFINNSAYLPIIVGCGSTVQCENVIDLSFLDGVVLTGNMGPVYAGLYNPSERDLKYLENHESIQMLVSRERMKSVWERENLLSKNLPDFLLVANRGSIFGTAPSAKPEIFRVNNRDNLVPVYSPEPVSYITDIAPLISRYIKQENRKVALIVLEGIGMDDFQWDFHSCKNTYSWYTYIQGECQYYTLTSGLELPDHDYAPSYSSAPNRSWKLLEMLNFKSNKVIGADPAIRSCAVGTRRIMTRIASGADITIEPLDFPSGFGCAGIIDLSTSLTKEVFYDGIRSTIT